MTAAERERTEPTHRRGRAPNSDSRPAEREGPEAPRANPSPWSFAALPRARKRGGPTTDAFATPGMPPDRPGSHVGRVRLGTGPRSTYVRRDTGSRRGRAGIEKTCALPALRSRLGDVVRRVPRMGGWCRRTLAARAPQLDSHLEDASGRVARARVLPSTSDSFRSAPPGPVPTSTRRLHHGEIPDI